MSMKNNNKFKLDLWGYVSLAILALYLIFLVYPLLNMFKDAVIDPATGAFSMAQFIEIFSKNITLNH